MTTQEGLYAKFFYSLDGKEYKELAELPTKILTDEQSAGFTGAHFGMYCHDMTGLRRYADFDYFEIIKTELPLYKYQDNTTSKWFSPECAISCFPFGR